MSDPPTPIDYLNLPSGRRQKRQRKERSRPLPRPSSCLERVARFEFKLGQAVIKFLIADFVIEIVKVDAAISEKVLVNIIAPTDVKAKVATHFSGKTRAVHKQAVESKISPKSVTPMITKV
jgi:hypothetical protein